MDVQNPPLPPLQKIGGEQPHETGKANDLDPVLLEKRLDFVFETVAIATEFCVIDSLCRDACSACDEEAASLRSVGYYQYDFGGIIFGLRSFYESRHVGAATGNKHSNAFAAHGLTKIEEAIINNTLIATFLSYLPERCHLLSGTFKSLRNRINIFRRDDNYHPDPAVERSQHFILSNVARLGEPLKSGSNRSVRPILLAESAECCLEIRRR